MNVQFKPYDSADYLKTEADIAGYLQAVAEENCDSPAYIAHALGVVARARSNMSQLARETGMSREGLYNALSENGNPNLSTLLQITRALGLKMVFQPAQTPANMSA